MWLYFVKTSLQNLRIALSMSPSGDLLRTRCRSYPGLVSSTTIDWMFPWPEQALVSVANVTLSDVIISLRFDLFRLFIPLSDIPPYSFQNPNVPESFRDVIVEHMVLTHRSVCEYTLDFQLKLRRRNYVTPKHYLDFINVFLKLLVETKNYINSQCNRLSGGW